MSQLEKLIAFEAAIALLHERGEASLLDEIEEQCLAQTAAPPREMRNYVQRIYDRFTLDELAVKVATLVRPRGIEWAGGVQIIYQDIEGLRAAIPHHTGDWCFTGRYPTPGGFQVLNRSYLNWRKRKDIRAY